VAALDHQHEIAGFICESVAYRVPAPAPAPVLVLVRLTADEPRHGRQVGEESQVVSA
jgi:hypothetical protein